MSDNEADEPLPPPESPEHVRRSEEYMSTWHAAHPKATAEEWIAAHETWQRENPS